MSLGGREGANTYRLPQFKLTHYLLLTEAECGRVITAARRIGSAYTVDMEPEKTFTEFDVSPPGGRWFRVRVPTRAERARTLLAIAGLVALSLLLWAVPLLWIWRGLSSLWH